MLSGPMRSRVRIIALLSWLAVLAPGPALAQTTHVQATGALDRFEPSPPGDTFFSLPSADVAGRFSVEGGAWFSYARDPLVLRSTGGGSPLEWVSNQSILHLQLGVELWKRVKLDLDVPILLAEGGSSGSLGPFMVSAPGGAHVGDVRIGARVVLLHQHAYVPAAALTFSIWVPVGSAASFSGAGVIRYQPGLAVGAEYEHLVWGASVGTQFQGQGATTAATGVLGSQVVGGMGVAGRVYGFTLGPEIFYGASLGDARNPIVSQVSGGNAELLLAGRYRIGALTAGLAGGPGLGQGPGTPSFRIVAGLSGAFDILSPDEPAESTDRGTGAGTQAPVPPPPPPVPIDTDGDGVPDAEDACPTLVGDATPGAYRRGCPPDRDRDGIFDVDDACPDVPGVPSSDRTKNGCPADRDGDGIPDAEDACPDEKGPPNADPKLNGCPQSVRVEGGQILILEQVNFDTGRDTIRPESFKILAAVAAVIEEHPDIARVAVDGHTDNRGGDKPNKNLSERRALSVVRWLTEHGVDARRLEARGFGQRRPVAANVTTQGRAQNRRVEFLIRRRTDQGKEGWRDGPIEEPPK
jgi:OmpA-OmpF porin, OOP family